MAGDEFSDVDVLPFSTSSATATATSIPTCAVTSELQAMSDHQLREKIGQMSGGLVSLSAKMNSVGDKVLHFPRFSFLILSIHMQYN
jgi:hypothetical protein